MCSYLCSNFEGIQLIFSVGITVTHQNTSAEQVEGLDLDYHDLNGRDSYRTDNANVVINGCSSGDIAKGNISAANITVQDEHTAVCANMNSYTKTMQSSVSCSENARLLRYRLTHRLTPVKAFIITPSCPSQSVSLRAPSQP